MASLVAQLIKNSPINTGNPSSISGMGRSPGEWIGYPLQYSLASLVAQIVKNPCTMQDTWVLSLDWEDTLERGWLLTPVFRPGEFHGQRSLIGYIVHGVTKSQTKLNDFHFHFSSSLTSWDIISVPKPKGHQHYLLFCLIIFLPWKKLYTTIKASLEKSFLLLAFLQPMAIILSFSSHCIHYGD